MHRNVRIVLLSGVVDLILWKLFSLHPLLGLEPGSQALTLSLFVQTVIAAIHITAILALAVVLVYHLGKIIGPILVQVSERLTELYEGRILANTWGSALGISAAEFILFVWILPAQVLLHVVASVIHWAIKKD